MEIDLTDTNSMESSTSPIEVSPLDRGLESPVEQVDLVSVYEMIKDGITINQPIDTLINKLRQASTLFTDKIIFHDMLADVFTQCDIEITTKEHREQFINLVKIAIKTNLLTPMLAYERLDWDLLLELGIINDKKYSMVCFNRMRTKLYFKQKKFNLLREESNGFSKILLCLYKLDHHNIESTVHTVTQIIGQDRCDPNRIIDLILEALEFSKNTDPNIYIEFYKQFFDSDERLLQLVQLKLTFYTNMKPNEKLEPIIPPSFYRLLAILISKNLIELDDIYKYLKPSDSKLLDYHQRLTQEAKEYSKKYNMAIMGEEKKVKSVYESLTDEDRFELEIDNNKNNLCLKLLDEGSWDKTLELIRKLPEYYVFHDSRVSNVACDYINYLIDPIYREYAMPKFMHGRSMPKMPRKGHKQITTIDDLRETVFPMLKTLGPYLSSDTILLTKLIRLLRYILTLKDKSSNKSAITTKGILYMACIDVIDQSILPSMDLSRENACLTRELWSLIRLFNYQTRYKLYNNWKEESSDAGVLRARGSSLLMIKHHMKRLSNNTIHETGRQIAKQCYTNPVVPLQYILVQIQSFDNLISMVVDAFRYLPSIAIDAALYCALETLSDPHKVKKSMDGLNIALWLTSISSFCANLILTYKVDFSGYLEYISHQLKAGNSLDLVLLTDLVQKMTGIEAIQSMSEDKIEAFMGGDILRAEGGYYNQDKRNTYKSSSRLKDALIECRLALPLCILMAKLRDTIFFIRQDSNHLKLIGNLYDQCQETFVQYGAFVTMNLSIEDYINYFTSVEKLMLEHKLDPDSAFFLARPMIMYKIKSKFEQLKEEAIKDLPVEEGETPELTQSQTAEKFIEAAKSVIDPLSEAIIPALNESYGGDHPNSKLFVIFWTLTMSDIDVPINCYEREIQRLKVSLQNDGLMNNISSSSNSQSSGPNSRMTEDEIKRRKDRREERRVKYQSSIQRLKQEQAEQVEHAGLIKMYLEKERSNLFTDQNCLSEGVHLESRKFDQHCPFARSVLSAADAIFSARFISYLHELKVDTFPTMICLDKILCDLTFMMSSCTEGEAHHFGRFLKHVLKLTAHWHSSESIFKEECQNHPGSIINVDSKDQLNYENYRHLCHKWHYRLTRSFTVALESSNYIQTRNALIVMIAVIDYYPAIKQYGKGIGLKIEEVRNNERESRQDLYALATSYAARLDDKKPHLVSEGEFHDYEPSSKERHSSSGSRKKARHN